MRMVDVTIVALLGIIVTIIGGYAAEAALYPTISVLNSTLRGDLSGDALATWDLVTGNNVIYSPLIWVVLTVLGFVLWWVMSVQKKDPIEGVDYGGTSY